IYFCVLPLLATRAILSIVYTVLIHSISTYSHYLDRLFFFRFSTFPTFPPTKFKIIDGDARRPTPPLKTSILLLKFKTFIVNGYF
ncbi:hypothetical protein CPAR01_11677, partial [Colletotrichum paranaense]